MIIKPFTLETFYEFIKTKLILTSFPQKLFLHAKLCRGFVELEEFF